MSMTDPNANANPQGGAAGSGAAAGASEGGSSGGAAPEYLSKADFEAFRREISGSLRQFAEHSGERKPAATPDKPQEPAKPLFDKYDFKGKGAEELERYHQDWYKYLRHQERAEEEKANKARQSEEFFEKTENEHFDRVAEYRKTHPEFDADVQKVGALNVLDEVKYAVFRHPQSAEILHYLFKNPAQAWELDSMARKSGQAGVMFRVGEIAAQIRAEAKAAEGNKTAAGQRPPRMSNLAGGGTPANGNLSYAQRFARFHGAK